jgi:two-component system NarL family sensor kinase
MLRRLPIESSRPLVVFAFVRLGLLALGLVVVVLLGFPYEGELAGAFGAGVAWAVALVLLCLRRRDLAMNPLIAIGDVALLAAIELVVPEAYGAVRFSALFFIAVHAHFQGERFGLLVAAGASVILVTQTALNDPGEISGDLLAFYETAFVAAALATALIVGRLRTTESASRLRARRLTRRTLAGESEERRRVAEALHDGPVQELIGMDMMLSAIAQASEKGDPERVRSLLGDAHDVVARNVRVLRDEILDLGPYAFEELSLEVALANCVSSWERRYALEVRLTLEPLELAPETAEDLFRIAQEAVANAGRHSGGTMVEVSLREVDGEIELRIADDGGGLRGVDPLGEGDPGHIGLASMRERTDMLGGRLRIDSSERGTRVVALVPADAR